MFLAQSKAEKVPGPWHRGYKTCLCSTELSMKFTLIINVKIPPIVGILTFISRINIPSESYETEQIKNQHFCSVRAR